MEPTAPDIAQYEQRARAYLNASLRDRAPDALAFAGWFDEAPLAGTGPTALFTFELPAECSPGQAADRLDREHYVACGGEADCGYFPAYGLTPDQAYSLHIGQRFMLGMQVRREAPEAEPPDAREKLRAFVRQCAPQAELREETLAALFRCDDQLFAVYRLRIGPEIAYCLGADCPPGFYRLTQHPPQVALTLHLGQLIREEARQERRLAPRE